MKIEARASEWVTALKAVTPHAATGRDAPMLNAVRLEVDSTGVYLVATDRYTLMMYRLDVDKVEGEGALLVDLADAQRIAKAAAGRPKQIDSAPVSFVVADNAGTYDDGLGTVLRVQDLGYTFPPYRSLIAGAVEKLDIDARASDLGFNPHLLAKWAKSCDRHGTLQLRFTTSQKVAVIVGERFVGLQMPFRLADFSVPTWAPGVTVAEKVA